MESLSLASHFLRGDGEVSLDLGLVDAVDADPHEVASDDGAPQGVPGGHVEVEAGKLRKVPF